MLEITHRRIAKEIAKVLKLSKRETDLLEVGSIHPDSWADFPHHQGKEMEIAENLLQARKLYLENDDECFFKLGVALHYITDSWTLRPKISDKHTEWEEQIEKTPILDDSQLNEVIKSLTMPSKDVESYLIHLSVLNSLVQDRLFKIEPKKYEGVALEEAAAKELMGLRGYKLIKRQERAIEDLLRLVSLDDVKVRAATYLTRAAFQLFSLKKIISFTAHIPKDEGNALIWCIPTQKIFWSGPGLLYCMKKVMEKVVVKRGIVISGSARFTQEDKAALGIELFITASDFCINTDPIPVRLSTWSAPVIDLNFAYRICLEVARLVFS